MMRSVIGITITPLYCKALYCMVLSGILSAACAELRADDKAPKATTAAEAFERLKALKGSWTDNSGTFGEKGKVAVVYEVVGGGSVVMERLFQGQPHEMVSMYHLDGKDLVMTHYCAARNQPRMKAGQITARRIDFDFAGGTNFDPAKDSHMHNGYIEFEDADHVQGKWFGWSNGKPSDHAVGFDLVRIKHVKP